VLAAPGPEKSADEKHTHDRFYIMVVSRINLIYQLLVFAFHFVAVNGSWLVPVPLIS